MRALNQSRISGDYEEIHKYEAINVKPPYSTAIPALLDTAKDKDIELTPCPTYIPTSFPGKPPDGVDVQYENINVGQSSSGGKAAVEGEYETVKSALIKEEVRAVGQSLSGGAEAAKGEYENVGQKCH